MFRKYIHKYIEHGVNFDILGVNKIEANDAGSKRSRFSYDYATSSYISTLSMIFHTQICQCAHKLIWSIDVKLEMDPKVRFDVIVDMMILWLHDNGSC